MAFWKCLGTDLEEHGAADEKEWEDDSSKQWFVHRATTDSGLSFRHLPQSFQWLSFFEGGLCLDSYICMTINGRVMSSNVKYSCHRAGGNHLLHAPKGWLRNGHDTCTVVNLVLPLFVYWVNVLSQLLNYSQLTLSIHCHQEPLHLCLQWLYWWHSPWSAAMPVVIPSLARQPLPSVLRLLRNHDCIIAVTHREW